jgi:hypothetical protein
MEKHRSQRPSSSQFDQKLGERPRCRTLRLDLEAVKELVRQLAGRSGR